jgi:NAD-dependent dihydropyrimidine dehydrogenase PreA subunit
MPNLKKWPVPLIDVQRCDGCGLCVGVCPTGALAMFEAKAVIANPDACEYDAACEDRCPQGAIGLPYLIVFDTGAA